MALIINHCECTIESICHTCYEKYLLPNDEIRNEQEIELVKFIKTQNKCLKKVITQKSISMNSTKRSKTNR